MVFCFKPKSDSGRRTSRKSVIVLIAAVIMLILILCVFSSALALPQLNSPVQEAGRDRKSDFELKLVHVIFRHGQRTPADTYPNDPHINATFAPYGWGLLTNTGKQQMYGLGEFLRKRYNGFLSETYVPSDITAQSTGVSRTKMSLQLALAGLYPPKGTALEWNKGLNWQPIPYDYQPLDQDSLLLVRTACPRYHEELVRVFAETEIKDELDRNKELFAKLTSITGMPIETPDDIQSLYSTLKAEKEFGLELPEWTKEFYPEKLQLLTDKSYVYNAYNSELKKLKGGVFVKKALNDWNQVIENKLKQKIFMYAGHDSSVTNILSAFKVWPEQFPGYGVTAILELYKNSATNAYGVEIFLRNSTTSEPHRLTIPGCSTPCPVETVRDLLLDVIPGDFGKECTPNEGGFTAPPAGGP